MAEIVTWFNNLPIFTRYWFGLSVAFPLLGRIGLLNGYHMIMTQDVIYKLHLWRPFTSLFYYPITPQTGFHYLMNLYFLYSYSIRLETEEHNGRPADYFFLLIFNWLALMIIGLFGYIYLLMDPMVLSVLYIWCQLNGEVIVTFWFGTRFKAKYLPWVLLGFNVLLGGGGFTELIGIVVGHLYYFVKYRYPQENGGVQLIQTPSILYDYFPNTSPRGGFFSVPPQQRRDDRGPDGSTRHRWGTGHVLGSD